MSIDILPDSRLLDQSLGSKVIDWQLFGGGTVRVEVVPCYCASCGKGPGPYVPRENTASAFYLCDQCAETYGAVANLMLLPDEVFAQIVAAEIEERFGRALTAREIAVAVDRDLLGKTLAALLRDSPYPMR